MIELVTPSIIIVSSLIILAIIYRMTGKMNYNAFLIGVGLLILTLVIQPPIQQIPVLLLGIDLTHASVPVLAIAQLYMAIVSGFLQELLKLLGVRGKNIEYALWLGAGFGFGEAVLIALNQIASIVVGIGFPPNMGLLSCYERFMVLLYHIFSATLLCYFYTRNMGVVIYIVMAIIHSLMNYQATLLLRIFGWINPVIIIVYSIITAIVIILYIVYWRLVSPWLKVDMYSTA